MTAKLAWTLEDVQSLLPSATVRPALHWQPIDRVCTDSREVQPGDCFVALKGDRFDGHAHIQSAIESGAVAVMLEHDVPVHESITVIRVAHTRLALGEWAAAWRRRWGKTLLAVTGSNGKTTVTQMVASILRECWGESALATQGNFNNDIGVPLTLLRLREHHQVAVLELGMNHPGEIAQLAAWAAPDAVLVNNAQREHQEFMKSVEAVASENASAFAHLASGGCAVFPSDDAFTSLWTSMAGSHQIRTFGAGGDVDAVRNRWMNDHWLMNLVSPLGPLSLKLHLPGEHNLRNAQAALALALSAPIELSHAVRGLEAFRAVRGRSELIQLDWSGRAVLLFNDTYNANPDSVRAAIDALTGLPGPRLLVLGDMGEVGEEGDAFHREVGQYAAQQGIDWVFTLGELSRHTSSEMAQGRHFERMSDLQHAVTGLLNQLGSLVVKGSRFMKMEQVVSHALTQAGHREASCC